MFRPLVLALILTLAACSAHAGTYLPWLYSGPGYAPQLPPSPPPSLCPFGTGAGDNGCAASRTLAISNAGVIDTNFAKDTASSGQLPNNPTPTQINTRNGWLHNASVNLPGIDYPVGAENPSGGGLVPISLFPCTENDLDNGTCNATTYPTQSDGVCTYFPTGFATSATLGGGPYLKCTGAGAGKKEVIQGYDFSNTTASFTSLAGATGSGAAAVQITGTNDTTSEFDFIDDYFQNNLEMNNPFTASQTAGVMTASQTLQLVVGQPVTGPGVPAGETVTGELGTLYTFSTNQTLGSAASPVALGCGGVSFNGYMSGSSLTITSGATALPTGCTITGTGVTCATPGAGGIGGCPYIQEYQSTQWTVSSNTTVASGPGWNSPQEDVWQAAHAAGGVGVYPFYIGGPPSGNTVPTTVKYINITVDGNTRLARSLNIIDQNFRNTAINDEREGPVLPYNWVQNITYSAIFDIGHNPMIGVGGGGVIAKYNFFRGNCQVEHDLCHGEIAEFPASQTTRNLEQYIGNIFVQNPSWCGAQGNQTSTVICGSATAAMYISSGTQNNTVFNTVDMENNLVVINNINCTSAPDYTANPFPGDGYGPNHPCGSSTQGAGDGLFAISGVSSIGTFTAKNNVLDGTGTIFGYSNGNQDSQGPPIVTQAASGTTLNKSLPEFNTLLTSGAVLGAYWPNLWLHVNSAVWPQTSCGSGCWKDTFVTGYGTYQIGPTFIGSTTGSSTTLNTTTTETLTAGDRLYNMVASTVPGGYQLNNSISATIATGGTGTSFTLSSAQTIASGTRLIAVNAPANAALTVPLATVAPCVPASEANCGTFTVNDSEGTMPVQTLTVPSTFTLGTSGQKKLDIGAANMPSWLNVNTVHDTGYIVTDTSNPAAIPASSYMDGFDVVGGQNVGIVFHYNLTGNIAAGDILTFYPIIQTFTYIGNVTPLTAQTGNVSVGGLYATRASTGPSALPIPPTTGQDGSTTGQSWGNVQCAGTSC